MGVIGSLALRVYGADRALIHTMIGVTGRLALRVYGADRALIRTYD